MLRSLIDISLQRVQIYVWLEIESTIAISTQFVINFRVRIAFSFFLCL